MRLSYLTFFLVLFLSCSQNKEITVTTTQIDSVILQNNSEKLPVFKDSELTNYVKEYDAFVEAYLTAIKNEDSGKIDELQKQSAELVEKAKKISEKLKNPAQKASFKEWLNRKQEEVKILN